MSSRVVEFADSPYKGWMASCLSCLVVEAKQPSSPRGPKGVEKEMKICHNQPHLVPPMKLVFYDNMPNSPDPRTSSFSQLVSEGRTLASRASSRTSFTIKKRATRRPTIGAPSDFRRVHLPSGRRLENFRPLELSIYEPGNRLSDLPAFDDFDFNNFGELKVPPRALIRARSETLLSQSSGFSVPRKPVTSMIGETSLNYGRRVSSPLPTDLITEEERTSPPTTSVIWNSLPGLPSPRSRSASEPHTRPLRKDLAFTLHPTIEEPPEHIPIPSAAAAAEDDDNITLDFPQIEEPLPIRTSSLQSPLLPPARTSLKSPPQTPPTAAARTRVSQWLLHSRAPSKETFYQCVAPTTTSSSPSPPRHTRTTSASTVGTTTIFSAASARDSIGSCTATTMTQGTTATTAATMSPKSRAGYPLFEKEVLVRGVEVPVGVAF